MKTIKYAFTAIVVGSLVGSFLATLFVDWLDYQELKEEWLQSAFNEGVEHGVCITVKALQGPEMVDKCFERKVK